MDDLGRAALAFWRDLDLDSRRIEWDKQGIDMASNQERSKRARRDIADNTKAYQRCPAEEKPGKMGPLLKLYQQEIDSLTARAKSAEGAFLSVYKQLYDAPDPTPLLQRAVDNADKLDKMDETEKELREYQEEFNELKNQEITVSRLEQELVEAKELAADQAREAVEQARADWIDGAPWGEAPNSLGVWAEQSQGELQQLEKEQQLLAQMSNLNEVRDS